jgi:prefoldin alpha subunit
MAESQQNDPQELLMQLRYLQSVYTQQYEALESDIATYTIANTSLQRNLELVEERTEVEGANIMIGGEGGAYIPAKIGKVESVMTYVGAGYMIEKSAAEAADFLRKNQKSSEDFLSRLVAEKQRVEKELLDISFKMSALQSQQDQR